jgi:hypothetical protein
VEPPAVPLKSILRKQTDPEKVQDQIEHLQNRLKFLRECRQSREIEKAEKRSQRVERPEETEYLSPRGVEKQSAGSQQTENPRFSGGIYGNLSESTIARLEKLKQDRKNKNAAAPAQPKQKFNYDKLDGIKNRFEGTKIRQSLSHKIIRASSETEQWLIRDDSDARGARRAEAPSQRQLEEIRTNFKLETSF